MSRRATLLLVIACLLAPAGCGPRDRAPAPEASWYPEEILSPAERREEASEKRVRLTAFLRRENLGGVLISSAANFAWITAGAEQVEPTPLSVFVREDGRAFLIGGGAEAERVAREELDGLGFEVRTTPWERSNPAEVGSAARELAGGRPFGSDEPCSGLRRLGGELAALRAPLTGPEIRKYRWLGKRCAEVVGESCRLLAPGMTERGIEALLSAGLMRHAIRPAGLRVAADARARDYGLVPPSEKARLEQSVLLGVSARRWGLTVRMARQVRFAPLDPDTTKAMAAVSLVNAGFWARTLPGATAGGILAGAIEDYARGGDSRPAQSEQGGAVGYTDYDWLARPGSTEPVRSGQAYAWRPSAGAVSVEDTILVLGDRLEVLTEIRGWPVVESRSLDRVYRTPAILVRENRVGRGGPPRPR